MFTSLESKIAALESENELLRSRPAVVVAQPVVTRELVQQEPVMEVYKLITYLYKYFSRKLLICSAICDYVSFFESLSYSF